MSTTPAYIAVENLPTSGAIVYWRLEGALDVALLTEAWAEAGLPEDLLPSLPAPSTALTRAVQEQAGGRTLVRPLEGKKGYAVVRERARGDELDHHVDLRVKLDPVGRPVFTPAPGAPASSWVRPEGCADPRAREVAAAFERHLMTVAAEDVGPWLVRLVTKFVDGVGLRDTGGIYFVPPAHVKTWELVTGAVRGASAHRTFQIPALRSQDAVQAVLDAVEQEARHEFDSMMEELSAGGLGEKAVHNRYDRVEDVEKKVARYEGLLGTRLDSLRERLQELQAALGAALLKG